MMTALAKRFWQAAAAAAAAVKPDCGVGGYCQLLAGTDDHSSGI